MVWSTGLESWPDEESWAEEMRRRASQYPIRAEQD
jgi:hypothetical protein